MIYFDKLNGSYKSTLFEDVIHGFGTKQSGDGRSLNTIQTLLAKKSPEYSMIVTPEQIHGNTVRMITDITNKVSAPAGTDGMITFEKHTLLTVITADCVPILYYDPVSRCVGLSHGGWKGSLKEIPRHVIESMQKCGACVKNIRIAIGPSIGPCCYRVHSERSAEFREKWGQSAIRTGENGEYLDLARVNKLMVRDAGIPDSHIDSANLCTACNKELFYSYFRDKHLDGEMINYIMIGNSL